MITKTFTYTYQPLTKVSNINVRAKIENSILCTLKGEFEALPAYQIYVNISKVTIINDKIKVTIKLSYEVKVDEVYYLKIRVGENVEKVLYFEYHNL